MRLSHFELEREIGSGGHGRVYLARDTRDESTVAVKILDTQIEAEQVAQRIVREGRILAELNSPHIVQVLETGYGEDRRPFIAMEYLPGTTLLDLVEDFGPVDHHQVNRWLREICMALQVAHHLGVIHRDLKPENILVVGEEKRIKVLDFGIAKFSQETHLDDGLQLTADGRTMGTLHYMSPEQLRGKALDGRSDLFSVGLLAHWMINGKHPFARVKGPVELLQVYRGKTSPPLKVSGKTGVALNKLVDSLLQYDVDKRPSDAGTVVRALEKAANPGWWRIFRR